MEEELMSPKDIEAEIAFEDKCGVNTLLQNLIGRADKVNVFKFIDDKNKKTGYKIRDKVTGEDVQY